MPVFTIVGRGQAGLVVVEAASAANVLDSAGRIESDTSDIFEDGAYLCSVNKGAGENIWCIFQRDDFEVPAASAAGS